jgi:hemerythrin
LRSSVIEWSDSLSLNSGAFDETHQEFIGYLRQIAELDGMDLLPVLDRFMEHTQAHFEQEKLWMEDVSFAALSCHVDEHDSVLEICLEVRKRVVKRDTGFGEFLAHAVFEWFKEHVKSMDRVLEGFLRDRAYEPNRV